MDIARWESPRGKYWVILRRGNTRQDGAEYSYRGNDCGGYLGVFPYDWAAIEHLQRRVDAGQFLPDKAKTPMRFIDLRPGVAV